VPPALDFPVVGTCVDPGTGDLIFQVAVVTFETSPDDVCIRHSSNPEISGSFLQPFLALLRAVSHSSGHAEGTNLDGSELFPSHIPASLQRQKDVRRRTPNSAATACLESLGTLDHITGMILSPYD
jgi:hypothetical protein